jgi:hypothetical protein
VRWLSGKEFFEMMHPPVVSPTAEPARKPMSVEEMRKAWNDPEELTQQCLIDYCRAIEKHHEIVDP